MTVYKFSLTSQCHKTTILHIMSKKEKSYLWTLAWYHPTTSHYDADATIAVPELTRNRFYILFLAKRFH